MGPKTKELIEILAELVDLLNEKNQDHWALWMEQAKFQLLSSDFYGIEKVLGAYGGMGSFNDIILDGRLEFLRSEACRLAQDIKHEIKS